MPDRQMASIVATLTTVDVYELASGIGNQFEKMIDTLGTESITGLMPMVIRALEYLEELTQRSENENTEICDLKFTVERLQAEKKLKAEEKLKFEKELEQIEDSWKMEAHAHREMITKLQDENHRLNSIIQQHKIKEINNIELIDEYNGLQEEIERLKVIISKQREELKSLDKSLDQQTTNAEMLETRVKQLCKQNSESHKKSHQMEKVAQNMIFEKSNIQSQLNDRDRQIAFLLEKVKRLETFSRDDISIEEQKRFFGHQEIVKQRDEMRTKVQALEEELVLLKYSNREMEVEASKNYGNDDDHDPDAPVQGPINREPDEKLYPDKFKRQSGIKKFFKNLLSPTKNTPGRMIPLRDPLQNSNSTSSGAIYRRSSLHSSSLSLLSSQKCHPF